MPQKIIIIRHGETRYNVERRLQDGQYSQPKWARTRRIAIKLASERSLSSDHKRAHITAVHIRNPLNACRELREDRMRIFEGWQWEKKRPL
jgi:broad specificity phosphatase PhoE